MPIFDPDEHERAKDDDLLQELNHVLIEYSVFTNSMGERRNLLVPLVANEITPEQLRMACQHQERTCRDKAYGPANIVNMIRDDPRLRATLVAAQKWSQRHDPGPAPGEVLQRENMEREALNPHGVRQRNAMYAYCAIEHQEVGSVAELAVRMNLSTQLAEELIEEGRRIYVGEVGHG